jgi:hypothetical protein
VFSDDSGEVMPFSVARIKNDYELVLRVKDKATGETQERIEPLRVTHWAG